MQNYLLNIFFRFSGYTFKLRQKIVKNDKWFKLVPYAILLIGAELVFLLISFPVYLLVKPSNIQEEGFIFPKGIKEPIEIKVYMVRRRITLTTIFSIGGIILLKTLLFGLASFYLFGAQKLLADNQDWTLNTASEYTYASSSIEFIGGLAQLKANTVNTTGTTTNPNFTSNSNGWTGSDWGRGAGESNPTETRSNTGGNPTGYIHVSIPSGSNDEVGGYWYQGFTTSVDNPTTNINFDWRITAFDTTPMPISYKVLVFVDNGSGQPVMGQEVWSSGELTSTTAWASITNLDVSSKVTTAGTYYLKMAVWVETPGSNSGAFTAGFDNVLLTWVKNTITYASNSPTTTPITALSVPKAISWNSFTETATTSGTSTIKYQMSADNGVNWKWWSGTAWATTTSITNYNLASEINTNISSFSTSTNQIKWRAYLISNGTQPVGLDNIAITYTQNQRPAVANLIPAQNTTYGYVHSAYDLQDLESDPSSLTAYEYSLNGTSWTTMTASTTDPAHNGVTGLTTAPAGVAHNFVWDAKSQLGNTYNATVYTRLRPNDVIGNGAYATSSAISVDYATSTVSNVVAVQNLGTSTVSITYDLFDNTSDNILVDAQISADGGSTWTIATSTLSGAVGTGVASGNGKIITWNALTDYPAHQTSTMIIRIRAKDKFQNQGNYATSSNFTLDTLAPVTLTTTNLIAQPLAGATSTLISGSFTEANPNTNDFYVAINNGAYGTSTPGDTNTAAPANLNTGTGSTLNGHDFISKVKIVHTDDYGLITTNENTSPTVAFKYVKPYTPQAPTLNNPVTNRLDLLINPNVSEASDVEYAIFEASSTKYVQSDGTLGLSPVWQIMGTSASQWGNGLGISGKVRITGLTSPVSLYSFKVKSRNPSDNAHAASSESVYSATASIPNTAPVVALNSYVQTTDGTQYTNINYTGTDGQGDINNITSYEYSTDNSSWSTMTEKSGVGSDGISSLVFLPTGSNYKFVWDSALNLPNVEDSTVYVRLRSNDTQVNSNLASSAALEIDNKLPVVSGVTASQNSSAKTVAINYTLTDANNSLIQVDVSSDGGSTWTVATSSLSGAIGSGVTPGAKTVTWNAGTNFNGQYNTQMMVRVRARDSFGNQGSYLSSSNFTVDTHAPVLTNITAIQDSGAKTFTFHYDVSEDIGNANVVLEISSNSGSTWVVATSTASGDFGSVAPGTNKTITWNAGTDYNNQEKTGMKLRLTATDSFTNSSNLSSADFTLDSQAPRIINVTAAQTLATTTVIFHYDLADQNNSNISLDISSDGGVSWNVASTSITGDINAISAGTNKTIIWDAGTDFSNQNLATMKVRLRGIDIYNNTSNNTNSSNFDLDTLAPTVNTVANLIAQPLAGATTALIGASFTEAHPDSNNFYVAIDDGEYGSPTLGTVNTATPANQLTGVGATLDGNDYISKVKVVHVDDFGQSISNENTSPSSTLKYVKPYVPAAATVDNPGISTVDVLINKNVAETVGLEYAVYEVSTNKYVQANGTLNSSPVWQTLGTGVGQWGVTSGVSGKISVNGLVTHSYLYQFQVKSRNTSDLSHAISSESNLSSSVSSANQSPIITINSIGQITDGTKYVTINYSGSDLESETSSLVTYQYSTDNSIWHTMTEKSGVGSQGTSSLAFIYPSTSHNFMWDLATDLNNTEDNSVYVRLKANDGTSDGSMATFASFVIDTKNPNTSPVTASQDSGLNNVTINYNLTDLSTSTVELQISSDGGSTWNVATSTATGHLGNNTSPGNGKIINWNPGVDYSGQEDNDVKTRVKATDHFGNIGSFSLSNNFSVDTNSPRITNISATQNSASNTVAITYDISDANNSTVELDISSNGGSSWDVADTSVTGAIGTGIASGTSKTITWNAGTDFPGWEIANMRVRLRATDTHNNATGNVESGNFSLDTKAPTISSVTANQVLATDTVNFNYSLADNGIVQIIIDISADSGSTWTVATSTLTGDIGSGVITGSKTVSWNAATNYNNQQNNTMKVRVRGIDIFNNVSSNIELPGLFSVDTLAPAINTITNLMSQPNAGDTTVSVGGSFTETNPNINNFLAAINGGTYNATTTGETNTASPANQDTVVGTTLNGNDYISKVKLIHTDDYNHSRVNENITPSTAYKYVKPYTPLAPTVNNPQNTSVDLTINPNASESSAVEYVIFEVSSGKYVQANGSLGTSTVWKVLGTAAGQWGNLSGVSGKIIVTGLNSPVANYSFKIKSRNPQDTAHANSSESNYSVVAGIINTAPNISITGASQSLIGSYALIDYTGTDTQNDTNNLSVYEYSINGTSWQAMTEKTGVGSDGVSGLIFHSTGTAYTFAWDVATDLPNQEQNTVYARLASSDTLTSSNLAASSAFYTDTRGPVISDLLESQTPGSNLVIFKYTLNDSAGSGNNLTLEISDDNGATYNIATTTVTGDLNNVSAGTNRAITWDTGTDFVGQESSTMKARIRGTDRYGNTGSYSIYDTFAVDAKNPIISGVSASQTIGTGNVVINYTLSDNTLAGHLVEFLISSSSGATWTVATSSWSGEMGSGQTTGAKSFTWNASNDFAGHDLATMKVQVRAKDYFGNQGAYATSAAFSLDTLAPTISTITATQASSTDVITILYNLNETATTTLDISSDGGLTWTVTKNTLAGDLGFVTAGSNKTVTWNAATDFGSQENSTMRVRLNGVDEFGNISTYYESSNFAVDTAAPLGLLSLNKFASTPTTVSLNWQVNTDANFNHYELWHGTNSADVNNRAGSASKWSTSSDANLSNESTITSVITGINLTSNYYVKIWAIDDFGNSVTVPQINVYGAPVITNISASQTAGSDNVSIAYDLVGSGNIQILMDISSDSGSTWTVASSSVTGDISNGITQGSGKLITWNAGVNYNNQQNSTMKLRLYGIDSANNTSVTFLLSGLFSLDTLSPATNIVSELKAQANAGDNVVLLGGSFTEVNPNTNNYYVAINGGVYSTSTAGDTNTATPADKETVVGSVLNGHDYISKVKLVHVDDFGHSVTNENITPSTSYKYVKPYTPNNPTVNNTQASSVDVTINPNTSEASDLEYAIYEISTGKYVQSNGSLNTTAIWQTIGTGTLQWGNISSVAGKITVTGLTPPIANYSFAVKSRNPSDTSHATSSESTISGSGSSANQSPVIVINSVAQTTNGTKYVTINYTGSDYENETSSLVSYDYSTDNIAWQTMTEKSGVGSQGTSSLAFANSGTAHNFVWDVNANLANIEDNTVYIRLKANDGTVNGGMTVSSAFAIDTLSPVTTAVTASQTLGSNNIVINYNLSSSVNSLVELEISSDSGATWNLATTTAIGHLGTGVASGTGKIISWNAGIDYADQENNNVQVRVRATDNFGNQSNFASSTNFSVNTKLPSITNVLASQNTSNKTVEITYDLSYINTSTIAIDISSDGGVTWNVTSSHTTGAIGAGVTPNTNKIIIWTAETDFPNQEVANMRVRIRATDVSGNVTANVESGDFSLNTITPAQVVIASVSTGASPIISDTIPPVQPILNSVISPTRETIINISGLAEPRTKIDLYDNNNFVGTLNSLADNTGRFNQAFTFSSGNHLINVRSTDSANNASSISNTIILSVVTAIPSTPIILTPKNNTSITEAMPQIIGVADANNRIVIKVDNNEFTVTSDSNGAWNFILPSTSALSDGDHIISATAYDATDVSSETTTLTINKITSQITITEPTPIPAATPGQEPTTTPGPITPTTTPPSEITSLPSAVLIKEATEATELPGIPVPSVRASQASVSVLGDVLSFTGTSLPNFDIVAYIHSNQALVYRTRTDSAGNWKINHLQSSSELTPGDHTIYAVAIDTNAKVKSRPSAVSSFTVQRNFWVMIFNYLDWKTTIITLIILIITTLWLYSLRKKRKA